MPQTPRTSRRATRAFTLTELLVVIGIIVLVLALAVPMFNIMQGDRSVEGGQNVLSAMLQRARARAIGMQERRGLFFFEDPASGQYMTCLVKTQPYVMGTAGTVNALELDPQDSEAVPLARGVAIAAAFGIDPSTTTGSNQKYFPYGVVMFDGLGRIEPFLFTIVNDKTANGLELARRFEIGPLAINRERSSTNAVVLYDKAAFPKQASDNPSVYTQEQWNWLDQNGLALVVNRYNGTLIRGE